jgi:hypothetical protein
MLPRMKLMNTVKLAFLAGLIPWIWSIDAFSESSAPPMVTRTLNHAYIQFDEQLEWILANPKAVSGNSAFKKIILERCNHRGQNFSPSSYDQKIVPLKRRALKAVGWYDQWLRDGFSTVQESGKKMIAGDFSDFPLHLFFVMESEGEPRDDLALVRYLAPNALIQSAASGNALEKLEAYPRKVLKQVESELIAAKPGNAFWMGGQWSAPLLAKLKKIFPEVYRTVGTECASLGKSPEIEPIHVNSYNCRELHLK